MSKPIKRSLLIHKVTYVPKNNDDLGWGEGPSEAVTVENVRLEPKTKTSRTATGETVDSTTTLFWDATFSDPVDWELDSEVLWKGKRLVIQGIDEYWDAEKLHHKEVRLI